MSRRESREYQNLYEVTETFNEGSQRSEPRSGTSPNKKKISLLNFDPNCRLSHFLSSPLSIEACKVLGIDEWELLARSKKDFRYENIPSKFKDYKEEFLELKAEHYEKCRLERLQNCIETRKKLYAKSLAKYQSNDSVANPMSYRSYKDEANLSLIMSPKKILETGRKHLTATKRKQNQEIELIMEIEDMKERLDTRMGDHMQRVTEIKESKKAEFERRKNEAQEEKVRREQRKVEIEKERERSLRRRLNYSLLDDKESKGDISLLDNSITIHSARGPAGEIPKLRMFATSDNLKKRSTSIQGAEELRKQIGEKLYSSKIEKSEGIKKSLDQQRKARLEDRRVSSDAKHEERQRSKSIKEEAKTLERERNYMDKLENNKRNKQRISEDKEVERREKSRRETEHAEQIRDKVRQGERELETKNQQLFEDLEIDLSRAEKQKKDTLSERRYLYMMNHLKEEEAKGNMRRKEKMLKYQEKKVGERIEAHSNRVTSRSREREMIAKENANVIRGLSQEKLQLKEGFAQLKKQLDKEHFNKYYASPSQLSTFRSVLSCRSESSSKYVKSRPRSPEQKDSARGKRETMAYLTDSGFSTPLRKLRAPSHERTRSGSKTLASSRRFQEERSSLAGISANTSYEMKEKKTQGVKDEVLEPGLPVLDEEGVLFAGKAFSIRSARKIGIEELIRTLDSEIKAQPKTQSTFKKSAEAIMNIVKLHNEYTENLMQETSYLDLPWASFNANKP